MPGFWEQLLWIAIVALSMVFGGYLYRKRHDGPTRPAKGSRPTRPAKGSHPSSAPKGRPRKKR